MINMNQNERRRNNVNNSGVQEILKALQLHSNHVESKINDMNEKFKNQMNVLKEHLENKMDDMKEHLENRMDDMKEHLESRMDQLENRVDKLEGTINNRFERLEKKMDGLRIEWIETQETVDYLASKNVQHERKLRQLSS